MQEEISALCEIFYDTIQIPASMHHPKDVDRPGFRIRLIKQDIISNQFFPDPCLQNITILHQAAALREHPQCIQTFHQALFKGSRCRRVCQISCQIIYDPCHICCGLPGKAIAVRKAHTLLPILS